MSGRPFRPTPKPPPPPPAKTMRYGRKLRNGAEYGIPDRPGRQLPDGFEPATVHVECGRCGRTVASFAYAPTVTVLPGPRPTPEPAEWFTVAEGGDVHIHGAITWQEGWDFAYWTVDADGALVGPDDLGSVDLGRCQGCGRPDLQVSRARLVSALVSDRAGGTILV